MTARFGLRDHLMKLLPKRITERVKTGDGCWEWSGSKTDRGYADTWWGDRVQYVHRIIYAALVSPIPEGMQIDHLCRNRGCVNPQHMEIVTNAENSRRGSKAKLTQEQVEEIRERRKNGEQIKTLAQEYGIDAGHCSALCSGYRNMWSKP